MRINLNNVTRYFARKLENHLYRASQPDNLASPAGRAAGSAIDSRKDTVGLATELRHEPTVRAVKNRQGRAAAAGNVHALIPLRFRRAINYTSITGFVRARHDGRTEERSARKYVAATTNSIFGPRAVTVGILADWPLSRTQLGRIRERNGIGDSGQRARTLRALACKQTELSVGSM